MSKTRYLLCICALVLISLPLAAGDDFELVNATIDAGGRFSQGGTFELQATTGQADAGRSQGAAFELESGFWSSERVDFVFSDSFEES